MECNGGEGTEMPFKPAKTGCDKADTCPLLEKTPELIQDDKKGIVLRDKQMGE